MGMVNVDSRAPACPPFIVALCERGLTAIHGRRPRSGRGLTGFPIWRSGDHFSNILPLDLYILSLLRQSAYSQISA
jgi:hypothetical protein